MNITEEDACLDGAKTALERIGLKVATVRPPPKVPRDRTDAWLRIGRGKEGAGYLVEVKCGLTAGTVGAVVAQLRDRATQTGWPTLLVTHHLTAPVADALRERGQQFADAAGNVYLNAPGLYVYVAGFRPKARAVTVRGGATNTANGLKILFALLCDPTLAQAPQRTLAVAANVALGAVPAALRALQAEGHVAALNKQRHFRGTKRLLDEWAHGYARRLRPKTLLATYTTERFDTWPKWALDPAEVRWGGESAAALLTKYLRPGVLTLYADRLPPRVMVAQQLIKEDRPPAQRYVEVRRPFWGARLNEQARPDIVPLVLVYADLLATNDGRCIETAQKIYEDHLARLLPAA